MMKNYKGEKLEDIRYIFHILFASPWEQPLIATQLGLARDPLPQYDNIPV